MIVKYSAISIFIVFLFASIFYTWGDSNATTSSFPVDGQVDKLRGMHFFGRGADFQSELNVLRQCNIRQLVLVPYAYQSGYDDPDLRWQPSSRPGRPDRDSLLRQRVIEATREGFEVVIKPHIWMRFSGGKWRSDIDFENETDWQKWAENYEAFILHYAKLAGESGVEYFCIGTELTTQTLKYPAYWHRLIRKVRQVFPGKVFYAANWYREYEKIAFWDVLDYVGVQAYFPLTQSEEPTLEELQSAWKPHFKRLKAVSKASGKPLLFTELGYKSTADAADKPWKWLEEEDVIDLQPSRQIQARCYEACFRTFWNEPWFGGMLIWQWHGRSRQNERQALDFTPQDKPAQEVMTLWFGQ